MSRIIPTTQTTIARFAAGLYGVKLGNPTLTAVLDDVRLSSDNGVNGLKSVLNSYYAPFASQTSAQVAAIVVANAGIKAGDFGLTAANVAAAVAIVTAELNFAAPAGNQGSAIASILAAWSNNSVNDAVYGAAARAWNLKIDQANAHANNAANTENVPFGFVNTEFVLAVGNDRVNGTDGNDTFIAGQGTLSSADVINGGGGLDTLKASISGIVSPTISGVEVLEFQAQFRATDTGDNNLADEGIVKVDFNTNVSSITGFTTIANSNSRADLIIEDVRIANTQRTEDITIVMRETDPGNVDYGVYFDQNSLRNQSSANSAINIFLMDTAAAAATPATPLLNQNFNSYTFYSNNVKVVLGGSGTPAGDAIDAATTYAALKTAFELALKTAVVGGVVTDLTTGNTIVTVGLSGPVNMTTEALKSATSATVAQNFLNLTGEILTLQTASASSISSTATGQPNGGWTASGTAPSTGAIVQTFNSGQTTASGLVTVKVVLDDVGRGSTGGDLVIGGLSVGETSTSKGVQKFLIEVQDNSKLQTIESTFNSLQEVVITNGITTRVDNAFNENQANAGSLTVRGYENTATVPNNGVGNNALPGSKASTIALSGVPVTPVGAVASNQNLFGFSDVKIIDASAMTGKFDFDAEVTQASIAKYLTLTDGAPALPATDNQAFVYTGGSNNDTMSVVLDTSVVGARNQLTGREDFSFTVNGGGGNDNITVQISGPNTANWYANHKAMKNLTVNAGEGNDTVTMTGTGSANVLAGGGNDTVYLDNSGVGRAIWVVNQSGLNTDPLAGTVPTAFLVAGRVTVSLAPGALAGGGVTGTSGVPAADAVAAVFSNGFEVVADIPTGANFAVSQFHINQAIKRAINEDAVLSKLLVATDGPSSTLNITSRIDGQFAANDLEIVVSSTQGATVAADVLNAFKAFSNNSAATSATVIAANTATVGVANAVAGVGVDRGAFAQATGSVVTAAVTVVTEGALATPGVAGTFEALTVNIDLAAPAVVAGGTTVIINGLTVTLGVGATGAMLEAALETGATNGFAVVTGSYGAGYVAQVGVAGTVIYSATTLGNVADLTVGGTHVAFIGTKEVSTYTIGLGPLVAATTVIINGLTVTLGAGATLAQLETALETGATSGAAVVTGSYGAGYVASVGAAGTVVYTSTLGGNVADLALGGTAGVAAGAIAVSTVGVGVANVVVQGVNTVVPVNAAAESVSVTFTGVAVAETITFASPINPVNVVLLAGDTPAQIATKFAAAVTAAGVANTGFATAVVTPAGSDTVVLTGPAATVVANFTSTAFTSSVLNTFTNGAISTVESDNFVNLGAGTDVAVLGTGVNSNDTVVFTGYENGKNTIVNFEDAVGTSRDMLDFTSYLVNKSSVSGSADSAVRIATTFNSDATVEVNSVSVITSAVFTTTNTFAGLTAATLLTAINTTGNVAFAGITDSTLNATINYTATGPNTTLVGGIGNAVVMVQNNANLGEYAVFELTFSGLATNTTAAFSAAQLIGVVDFGNDLTPAAALFA